MAIPELRLNGYADVLAIEACPEIENGPGEVVTATYQTDRAAVVDLRFAGGSRPIGTTAAHPFWSVSRQDFVDAGDLEIGEAVVALDGQHFRLTSITARAGPEPVYNFEVANQHVYYVSDEGLLVHNAGKFYLGNLVSAKTGKKISKASDPPKAKIKRTAKTKKAKNGNTSSAISGKKAHKNYSPGTQYTKEVVLKNGKRIDAIDRKNFKIRELKPNSHRNLSRGKSQLEDYVKQLEKEIPSSVGKWKMFLDFYKK